MPHVILNDHEKKLVRRGKQMDALKNMRSRMGTSFSLSQAYNAVKFFWYVDKLNRLLEIADSFTDEERAMLSSDDIPTRVEAMRLLHCSQIGPSFEELVEVSRLLRAKQVEKCKSSID